MIENRKNYRLDVDKIKTIKDVKNVLDNLHLIGYYDADDPNDENYYLSEYFTIPQERQGLTFSTPHKTLDEISQELDEKFEKLIEQYKRNSYASKLTGQFNYELNFNRIIEKFEYAKEHGRFKETYTLDWSNLIATGSNVVSFTTQYRVGDSEVGYWDIKPNIKVYLEKKPNRIVRFFTKLLLDFEWKSTK